MDSNSLVSIVIPTYNRASILVDALDSCANQTHKNIEIVIVDDGSSDDTEGRVAGWKKRDTIYRKVSNSGSPTARNLGVRLSSGKFIKFLDSDDILAPDVLETQVLRYSNYLSLSGDIASGYHAVADYNLKKRKIIIPGKSVVDSNIYELSDVIRRNPPTSSPLYRREQIEAIGGFDENLPVLQDYDLAFRIARAGFRYRYFNDFTYFMRTHNEDERVSASNSMAKAKIHHSLLCKQLRYLDELYLNEYPLQLQRAVYERCSATARKLARSGYPKIAEDTLRLVSDRGLKGSIRGVSWKVLASLRL